MFFLSAGKSFTGQKASGHPFFNARAAARRPGPDVFAAPFAGGAAPRAGRRRGKVRKNNDSPARRGKTLKPVPCAPRRRFCPAGVKHCWLFPPPGRPCGARACHVLSAAEPRLSAPLPGEGPPAGQFVRKYVNFGPEIAPFSAGNRPCRRPFVPMEPPIHPMEPSIHPMQSPIRPMHPLVVALPPCFAAFLPSLTLFVLLSVSSACAGPSPGVSAARTEPFARRIWGGPPAAGHKKSPPAARGSRRACVAFAHGGAWFKPPWEQRQSASP